MSENKKNTLRAIFYILLGMSLAGTIILFVLNQSLPDWFGKTDECTLFSKKLHDVYSLVLKEKRLITIKNSYALKSPYQLIDKKANKYLQIVSKLETLSPLLTIKRGYSITRIDGKVLSSVKKIKKKDVITVEFSDGDIKAEVL